MGKLEQLQALKEKYDVLNKNTNIAIALTRKQNYMDGFNKYELDISYENMFDELPELKKAAEEFLAKANEIVAKETISRKKAFDEANN